MVRRADVQLITNARFSAKKAEGRLSRMPTADEASSNGGTPFRRRRRRHPSFSRDDGAASSLRVYQHAENGCAVLKTPVELDKDQTIFDGCYNLNDAKFDYLKEAVRPDWLSQVQRIHFVCILIMALALLMIGGFGVSYWLVRRQTMRKGRPWNSLVMAKAGTSLWFVLVSIVAILEIVEPSMFYYNFERNRITFYSSGSGGVPLNYAGGFILTIVSAVLSISTTVLGVIIFTGIIKKTTMLMGENFVAKRLEAASRSSVASSYAAPEKPITVDLSQLDPSDEIIEKLSQDPEDRWSRHSRSDAGSYQGSRDVIDSTPGNGVSSSVGGRPAPAPRRHSQSSRKQSIDTFDGGARGRAVGTVSQNDARSHNSRSMSPHRKGYDNGGGGHKRTSSSSPSRRSGSSGHYENQHPSGSNRPRLSSSSSERRMMAAVASRASAASPSKSRAYTPKAFTPVAKNPVYTTPEPQIAKNKLSTYVSY